MVIHFDIDIDIPVYFIDKLEHIRSVLYDRIDAIIVDCDWSIFYRIENESRNSA